MVPYLIVVGGFVIDRKASQHRFNGTCFRLSILRINNEYATEFALKNLIFAYASFYSCSLISVEISSKLKPYYANEVCSTYYVYSAHLKKTQYTTSIFDNSMNPDLIYTEAQKCKKKYNSDSSYVVMQRTLQYYETIVLRLLLVSVPRFVIW